MDFNHCGLKVSGLHCVTETVDMFVLVVMRFVGMFAAISRRRLCRHRKTRMAQIIENTTTKTVGTRMCGK